ncbi:MAG: hypothetical protein JWO76_2406 [Nocardioides sp.]|nr:hypothetical protein [Nocardioides sp.]
MKGHLMCAVAAAACTVAAGQSLAVPAWSAADHAERHGPSGHSSNATTRVSTDAQPIVTGVLPIDTTVRGFVRTNRSVEVC